MHATDITRAETAERARLLHVESYDIHLDLTRGSESFGSTSVVVFACAEPGAASYVDLICQTVHEITLNGTPVDPTVACADGRIALPGLAARNELRVVADCAYSSDVSGLSRTVDTADGRTYTFTQFEPADARRVFANFEQPDLKAAFTFHVTAPEHWIVLSNQPAAEPQPAGAGTAVWHFEPTPRISTYLTAIVAGEYCLHTARHVTPGGQVIPLGLACRQSLTAYLDTADILTVTRQGLDYFTGLFGTDYPFAKFDQAFVADHVGGMENVGLVTLTERALFRSRVTDLMYESRALVILHELAHQWFGDLVTMKWWNDLWLNESFAEFAAFLAAAEATRFAGAWTSYCSRKAGAYLEDQMPSTHPIAADATTVGEAMGNADSITYIKGGAVLKQLAAFIGRDNFLAGLHDYFTRHGWGNATLAELLAALEQSSGRDLAAWSGAWLETAGPNTLRADVKVGTDDIFTSFDVLQEAPEQYPTLRSHHIAIGLYNRLDGALVRTHRVELEVAGARTAVPSLAGAPQPDLILLNDDDLGYAIVRFDDRSLRTLSTSIGDFTDPLARTICWSAVLDMAQQAELSVPAFVSIVAAGMGSEASVSVLQLLHMFTRRLLAVTADPAWVPAGKELLAARGLELLHAAEPGSDHQLAWAELAAWSATSASQLALLEELLAGTTEIAEHQRILRGVQVQADNIGRFCSKLRVGTDAPRAMPAQLNAFLAQHPPHRGVRNAERHGQGTTIPPGQSWRRRQLQLPQKARAQLRPVFGFFARPRLIAQPGHTARRKPLAPQADRVWPHPKLARYLVIPLALKASENDLGALDHAGFLGTATGKVHQFRSLLERTRQRHRDPGHATPQLVCEPKVSYKISHNNAFKH